jgi:hypothetical protein
MHAMPASGRQLGALHTGWQLPVQRVEAERQVAVVGGDGNLAAVVATGTLSEHAPGAVGLSGQYCSTEPAPFGAKCCFSNYSNFAQILKYKMKTILMSKIIETWHGVRVDYSKQLIPLGLLPIPNIIQVIKLGTNSNLNFSLNF